MRIHLTGAAVCLAIMTGAVSAQTPVPAAGQTSGQTSGQVQNPAAGRGADGAPPASTAQAPAPASTRAQLETGFQGPLVVHFDLGSSNVRAQDEALLDQASRLYREGHPLAMILTGGTDSIGLPEGNLRISQLRTAAVLRGLVARGIPAERFQLLAKGETDPIVPTEPGKAQPENRRVEIRWR
jgi:outer membrane protein OmpA-like peptidoglycan-associated protein